MNGKPLPLAPDMTPEERIALVRDMAGTIPVFDGCAAMTPDEAVRVYLNDEGGWRTWEDENPDYVDDGAPYCCTACEKPVKEGFVSEDGDGPYCSPFCLWDGNDVESIRWDFSLLGDVLYWTDWEEPDPDEGPYFLNGGEA